MQSYSQRDNLINGYALDNFYFLFKDSFKKDKEFEEYIAWVKKISLAMREIESNPF